ncbi:hypothetical protein [Hyphomicrobium sp. ghe19]|uniref:hypothetical protein n=1 Tax=Hyphomicrobium sp. ghe19 TaxID=2682968 RepID=UPI0013676430|nr:hypothetical protein HYPP_03706 [Hyphomicrobium sp. ghe19]
MLLPFATALVQSRCLAALGFALLGAGAASAANVSLEVADGDAHVVVEAQDATVQDVLQKLSEGHGFKVERADQARDDAKISGRFEGPFSHVLERVLEKENHFVEHGSNEPGAITRVVLYGAQPAITPQADAPSSSAAVASPPRPKLVEIKAPRITQATPSQRATKPASLRRLVLNRQKRPFQKIANSTAQAAK